MNTFGDIIKLLLVINIYLFIFVISILPYQVLIECPFSIDEMDINKIGFLSPIEAGYFADYGTKEYIENGKKNY